MIHDFSGIIPSMLSYVKVNLVTVIIITYIGFSSGTIVFIFFALFDTVDRLQSAKK